MEIILAVIVGFLMGMLADKSYLSRFHKYLSTPSSEKLELNWTGKQLLALVSKDASKRWYEARAHMNQNLLLSILCTLGLVYLVRYEYTTEQDGRHIYQNVVYHGFRSYPKMKELIVKEIPIIKGKLPSAEYYYQTFIAGHNVVGDFMTDFG